MGSSANTFKEFLLERKKSLMNSKNKITNENTFKALLTVKALFKNTLIAIKSHKSKNQDDDDILDSFSGAPDHSNLNYTASNLNGICNSNTCTTTSGAPPQPRPSSTLSSAGNAHALGGEVSKQHDDAPHRPLPVSTPPFVGYEQVSGGESSPHCHSTTSTIKGTYARAPPLI